MDEDTQQRLKGGFTFMLEFYKICMGTFLTVFVPHQCYETTPQGEQSTICTVSYNVYHGDDYHRRVIWFNLVSFVVFVSMYYMEVKRENWCINYLDIDYSKASDNLDDEIEEYPVFKYKMRQLNKNYDILVKACSVTQLFNIAISVADVGRSWAGSASFTPMLSYILLIASKLYTTYMVSTASLKSERAYSAYLTEPKTYNTIDKDHRNIVQETDISVELAPETTTAETTTAETTVLDETNSCEEPVDDSVVEADPNMDNTDADNMSANKTDADDAIVEKTSTDASTKDPSVDENVAEKKELDTENDA